ncbi:hypothetical protein [Streptomyces olivaceus]|uniref:hypothetical protein n=1 Tax=Streptomyces olivaceus TaxID=47716 RepID=UPI001CCBAC77|nr:hypothetical protein [Streptomyces olivaceus]MBZ6142481.1 hypothetical protein [Streptomyces olivaceus]MBZ6170150.1 hypothetical protein [Streptomyces olivaceus]
MARQLVRTPRVPHPSTLPPLTAAGDTEDPQAARVQVIEVRNFTVRDPGAVLLHGHQAGMDDPQTASLLHHEPGARMSVHTAAALLAATHDTEDLTGLGLELTAHTARIAASPVPTAPALLEIRHDTC